MVIESILSQIDDEIYRLTQVRALLSGTGKVGTKVTKLVATGAAPKPKRKKRRVLSPEARKRIADAQHRRWAAQKAKTRKEA